VDPVSNKIVITSQNVILWNGRPVTLAALRANLEQSKTFAVEPELQFVPEPQASYDLSAEVLNAIKEARVTKFGFVGNEKYRTSGSD
jgi:biopolymer transport protein ExbD